MEHLAAREFYTVIQGFRNTRHHYLCRPWKRDGELEDYALWIWLWLCQGLTTIASGARPVLIPKAVASDVQDLATK